MSDQAERWSEAASVYEQEFVDPDQPGVRNPIRPELSRLVAAGGRTVLDLGCGTGPRLPFLSEHFNHVFAVDFAEGMLDRARQRCKGLDNVRFLRAAMTDLSALPGKFDVVVAVNSLVLPDLNDLSTALAEAHRVLK